MSELDTHLALFAQRASVHPPENESIDADDTNQYLSGWRAGVRLMAKRILALADPQALAEHDAALRADFAKGSQAAMRKLEADNAALRKLAQDYFHRHNFADFCYCPACKSARALLGEKT